MLSDDEGNDDIGAVEPVTEEKDQPSKCRYEIKVGANFYEFKSWGKTTIDNFLNPANLSKRKQFANQLKAYLEKQAIDNLDKLNYIFDGRRIYNRGTVSETKAKEILQRVFRDDPAKFYLARPSLFAPYSLSEFIDLVNSDSFINNSILRFVKTK